MTWKLKLTSAALALALAGCGTVPAFERVSRANSANEVASVTVAPISITRWDDVAGRMQPAFAMDAATALAMANPTTQSLDQRFADILAASLQAAFPVTARTTETTVSGDPADGLQTDYERVTTDRSGDASGIAAAPLPPAAAALLAGLTGGETLNRDPMMRYLAATALYQEVNLLNRYVTDAVRPRGTQAYVIRLQLSVMPTRRSQPYDVQTDITIHGSDEMARAGLGPVRTAACLAGQTDYVTIVPMLVTDNLETMAVARTQDHVRQLGLAMLATAGNVGLGGSLGRTEEALQASRGNDVNSLLTVARLSDDTVRVRLGAAQSPRSGLAMLPRTHNISLLVLYKPCSLPAAGVESEERILTAVTKTSFVDVTTGRALAYQSYGQSALGLQRQLNSKYDIDLALGDYISLFRHVSSQNRTGFYDYLETPERLERLRFCRNDPDPRSADCLRDVERFRLVRPAMWTDLVSARPTGEFSFANLPVEVRRFSAEAPPDQTVVVSHDAAGASTTLYQARDLQRAERVRVSLEFDLTADSGVSRVTIPARDVAVSADGASITARFPPLAGFGVQANNTSNPSVRLDIGWLGGEAVPAGRTYGRVRLAASPSTPPPGKPAFTLALAAAAVVIDEEGRGRINLAVNPDRTGTVGGLRLTVGGADVVSQQVVRGVGLTADPSGWKITGAGEVTLLLDNLVPGQVLTFGLIDAENKAVGVALSRPVLGRLPAVRPGSN